MRNLSFPAIILLGLATALLIASINVADSSSSSSPEPFQSAPGNGAIVLMVLGVIAGSFGLVRLLRRRT